MTPFSKYWIEVWLKNRDDKARHSRSIEQKWHVRVYLKPRIPVACERGSLSDHLPESTFR